MDMACLFQHRLRWTGQDLSMCIAFEGLRRIAMMSYRTRRL